MLLWKQLNYIPISLLPLHSNIHYVIRESSRDRFDESPACVLTRLKAPGFLWRCKALLSVVLFPVWTSGRVICPICYQEFIPHRRSMETIVCLGLTHPEQRCIMFTAAIVPARYKVISISHMFCHFVCLNGIYMLVFRIMESNCHKHKHTHKHQSWHRKRASTGRVHVEVLPFLCAIWANLWTLCACVKRSIHPCLWYQTPAPPLDFFFLFNVVASFSFPWAIMGSWQQNPVWREKITLLTKK